MNNLIIELNQEETKDIYGGAEYVWVYIEGVKKLVAISE